VKTITPEDEHFLTQALSVVEKHLANKQFDAETLAREVGMSRAQLNGKLQTLLGQNGQQFIMAARLRRSAEILREDGATVGEILREDGATVGAVASRVGFKSASYFARCFKKRFGCLPSEFN
jgi:AraC-like DNA-binding protein